MRAEEEEEEKKECSCFKEKRRYVKVIGKSQASIKRSRTTRTEPSTSASPPPPPPPLLNPQASASVTPLARTATPADPDDSENEMAWYKTVIFQALSTMNKSAGCSVNEIAKFIRERYWVPMDFRQLLSSKLSDLVLMGTLEMDQSRFKIMKVSRPSQSESHNQTLEEEAVAGDARMKAAAKHKAILAAKVIELKQRVESMSEENDAILGLAEEIWAKCKEQGREMAEEANAMRELVNEIYRKTLS